MKFLIKNYNKDADDNKEILATVLFEVETIKCVKKIPDSWLDDSIGIVFSARNY